MVRASVEVHYPSKRKSRENDKKSYIPRICRTEGVNAVVRLGVGAKKKKKMDKKE